MSKSTAVQYLIIHFDKETNHRMPGWYYVVASVDSMFRTEEEIKEIDSSNKGKKFRGMYGPYPTRWKAELEAKRHVKVGDRWKKEYA